MSGDTPLTMQDIEDLLRYATPAELELFESYVDAFITHEAPIFVPQPGPQMSAWNSRADIIGFGGQAGGGKSGLIIGLALTEHTSSLILRHEATQLSGIVDDIERICGHRNGYNSQRNVWRNPVPGKVIEFGSMPNPGDELKFKGRPHDLLCVAGDTPVRMANGSYKEMAAIQTGDWVETLHGARRVTKIFPVRKDEAIRMDLLDENGVVKYSQKQSISHEFLTFSSLDNSSSPLFCFDVARLHDCGGRYSQPSRQHNQASCLVYGSYTPHHLPSQYVRLQPQSPERLPAEISVSGVLKVQESDCEASLYQRATDERRLSDCGLPGHLLPIRPLAEPDCVHPESLSGVTYAGSLSESPGSLDGYQERFHSCDERPPESSDRYCEQADGQPYLQQPSDAELPNPSHWQDDGREQTPIHIFRNASYVHPYTKEIRQTDASLYSSAYIISRIGEIELYDIEVEDANHYITGPGIINKNCFDELTEFREDQFRFVQAWARTTDKSQRVRIVASFNPPSNSSGRWVIKYFAPWLDKDHPNRAMPGELRWFAVVNGEDIEVPDNRPFVLVDDQIVYDFDPALYNKKEIITAESRTFIPSSVIDNTYLDDRYIRKLQGLPEPLRSQMLFGEFTVDYSDEPNQVIPTAWIEAAMARWEPWRGEMPDMTSMGVDVARSGKDKTEIARRHDWWFDKPISYPGSETPDGRTCSTYVMNARRNDCPVHLDAIGVGTSPADILTEWGVYLIPIIANRSATGKDKTGFLTFANVRSWMWWKAREMLDPDNGYQIALPKDKILAEDLAAPRYIKRGSNIYIESREDIIKTLKRSPDRGTAYVQAMIDTPPRRPRTRFKSTSATPTHWELA